MTLKEEDLSNTGELKRDIAKEAVKIARRENPTLFDYFSEVCESNGQDPEIVIGDMVIKAIDNEAYADSVLDEVVQLGKLNQDQMRKEDAQMVQDLMDALGLDESDGGDDPIDKLIQKRFEAATSGPMGMMNQNGQGQDGQNPRQTASSNGSEKEALIAKIEELERELNEIKGDKVSGNEFDDGDSDKKDIDELFGDEDNGGNDIEDDEGVEENDDEGGNKKDVDDLFDSSDGDSDTDSGGDEDEGSHDVEEIHNDVWTDEGEDNSDPISSEDAEE